MYKLTFYVPESHLDEVKKALFNKGAGVIGPYDSCAWQVLGQGQFRPQASSQPFIGDRDCLETVPEYLVEMVCADDCIKAVVKELVQVHPYEQPAYAVWQLEEFNDDESL